MTDADTAPEAPSRRQWSPQRRAAHDASRAQRQPQRGDQRVAPQQQRLGRTATGRLRINQTDMFWYDVSLKPPHVDYQWNVVSVLGDEKTVNRQVVFMHMNGWTPVPASRHPEIMGPNPTSNEIVIGGQRLEERPIEMTLEARQEDHERAVSQVKDNFRQLKHEEPGHLPRRNRQGDSMVSIRREGPMQVPEGGGGEYEYEDGV